MIIIAASLYLPEHIATMVARAWFYYAGDEGGAGAAVGRPGGGIAEGIGGRSGVVGE